MTSEPPTCPYCNAAITVPPGATAGQRILCPRCGDAFALRFTEAITSQPPPSSAPTGITTAAPPTAPPRRSNRLIAGVVLGMMVLMAGVGLTFMLMTTAQRRAHDTSRPPRRPGRQPGQIEPELPAVVAIPPDKLLALGYVPPRSNFLIAARIPELLATPSGAAVLRDPVRIGQTEYRLEGLPRWLGLRLEDIDHLVFAARIDDSLIPPFVLIFRLERPYEAESLRQRIKGNRLSSASKKTLYSFRLPGKDITLYLWCVDERTMLLSLFPDQLEALPAQPVEDLRQLPEELRSVLKSRREPAAPAWLAGHSPDWSKTSAGKFLSGTKKNDLKDLANIQTFALWLVPERTLQVRGVFGCTDAAAAGAMEKYFHDRHGGDDPSFKTALDGSWLTLHYQTGPDFLSRLLKR